MDLIRNSLETICGLANAHLENLDRRGDAWIVLTSPTDHSGQPSEHARDKIVMCVCNISRETFISNYAPAKTGGDSFAVVNPPLYIDLQILFMANFSGNNYSDGLAALSRVIAYFQQTPSLTQQNAPGLAPGIDKLTMELENVSPAEVNYVMGMLGTRYLPSVFYKLRMLPFVSSAMQSRAYPVTEGSDPGARHG